MKLEILYYDNGVGGTAISVDGGEHVIVRTGRVLLLTSTSWEEADEEDCGPLSPSQAVAVRTAEATIAALTAAESEMSEIVLAYRKRRLRHTKSTPIRPTEKPNLVIRSSVMIEYSDLIND